MEFRMTAITAKDNPSIQLYRKLVRQRKARTQNQQFVLEGYRLVTDAVHFSRKLTHLFLTEAAWERYPQGVFAICQMPAEQVPIVAEGTYLVLYQLQDPGNMGMLLRTAAAMGVSGVICCQSCDFYSPKVVRATMGALFHVPVMQMPDAETVLQNLRTANIVSCASVVQGDAEQVGLCELGNGCAVWIGNEGNGLPEYHSDERLYGIAECCYGSWNYDVGNDKTKMRESTWNRKVSMIGSGCCWYSGQAAGKSGNC